MQLIVAEKPSVARDIARVLGVRSRGDGYVENDAYAITWCIGHLVELAEPAAYDARWKAWRLDNLPMLPEAFELVGAKHAFKQLRIVSKLLRDKRFASVVNACDAGREGELIFRYVYHHARSRLPMQRLWISSLTDDAIRRGFATLQPGRTFDALGDAARSRSEADWLVGMNATRAVTVRGRDGGGTALYSIGRVQTPTLAMLVERDREIDAFVPRPFWEIRAELVTRDRASFAATWRSVGAAGGHGGATAGPIRHVSAETSTARVATAAIANAIVDRDTNGTARVERVRAKTVREPPPLLFDLTSLQRTANKRFGFSAARTLEIAQALYERHKVLTYPRTDSRHLTGDVARELPAVFAALAEMPVYAPFASRLAADPPRPSRRVVDDAKVHDHHAIIPTGKHASLDRDEVRVFDLVVRRFIGAFYPDAEFAVTEAWISVAADDSQPAADDSPAKTLLPPAELEPRRDAKPDDGAIRIVDTLPPPPDHYVARGRVRLVAGWQEVAGIGDRDHSTGRDGGRDTRHDGERDSAGRDTRHDGDRDSDGALPPLVEGQRLDGSYRSLAKHTTPPPRYTEATLLGAMETAGRSIDDEALRAAMKDCGLGTPATRASIIETLLKRGYIERAYGARDGSRDGGRQHLRATATGIALIRALPVASLTSAELTGSWEARLAKIARGHDSRAAFMADIRRYVTEIVDAIRGAAPPDAPPAVLIGRCPQCGHGVVARARDYKCTSCDFAMSNRVAGRMIAPALAGVLLGKGHSQVLRGFRSKKGKKFSAGLRLEPDGKLAFEFERRSSETTGGGSNATASIGSDEAGESSNDRSASATRRRRGNRDASHNGARKSARVAGATVAATTSIESIALTCPRCKTGSLIAGSRGWGCTRWRDGCRFVVWFVTAGKKLTTGQLRDLVTRGKTRKAKFGEVDGRLVLDLAAIDGSARLERVGDA